MSQDKQLIKITGKIMNSRIKQKDLEVLVNRLNIITNNPITYNNKETRKTNIGHYCLDYAYGGVKLVQVVNDGGGIKGISSGGFGTKRDLCNQLVTLVNFNYS